MEIVHACSLLSVAQLSSWGSAATIDYKDPDTWFEQESSNTIDPGPPTKFQIVVTGNSTSVPTNSQSPFQANAEYPPEISLIGSGQTLVNNFAPVSTTPTISSSFQQQDFNVGTSTIQTFLPVSTTTPSYSSTPVGQQQPASPITVQPIRAVNTSPLNFVPVQNTSPFAVSPINNQNFLNPYQFPPGQSVNQNNQNFLGPYQFPPGQSVIIIPSGQGDRIVFPVVTQPPATVNTVPVTPSVTVTPAVSVTPAVTVTPTVAVVPVTRVVSGSDSTVPLNQVPVTTPAPLNQITYVNGAPINAVIYPVSPASPFNFVNTAPAIPINTVPFSRLPVRAFPNTNIINPPANTVPANVVTVNPRNPARMRLTSVAFNGRNSMQQGPFIILRNQPDDIRNLNRIRTNRGQTFRRNCDNCNRICTEDRPICTRPITANPNNFDDLRGFGSLCHMVCYNSCRRIRYEMVAEGRCRKVRDRLRLQSSGLRLNRNDLRRNQYVIDRDTEFIFAPEK